MYPTNPFGHIYARFKGIAAKLQNSPVFLTKKRVTVIIFLSNILLLELIRNPQFYL